VGKRRKRKEAGKIVVKKRRRIAPRLPRIRWDIITLVVIVGLIVAVVVVAFTGTPHQRERRLGVEDLRNYLGELSRGNRTIALDLSYDIRGDIPYAGKVIGVKDVLQVDIRYYELKLAIPQNKTNTTKSLNMTKTRKVSGYLVFYYGLEYLPILNDLLGMRTSPTNLSEVLISIPLLKGKANKTLKVDTLGYEVVELKGIGEVECIKKVIRYKIKINNTEYNVKITLWSEKDYGIPIKAVLHVNDYTLNITLRRFSVRSIAPSPLIRPS